LSETDFEEYFDDVQNSHDRSAVVIVVAQIEYQLQRLLTTYLPNNDVAPFLFENGPLSGLYAKNVLAFGMGLIDKKTFDDLEIIRRIRNAFAHSPAPIKFLDGPVLTECRKLSGHPIHKRTARANAIKNSTRRELVTALAEIDLPPERDVFLSCASDIILEILKSLIERGA
jgi:DNA-binding MltR family transcriptional regulator